MNMRPKNKNMNMIRVIAYQNFELPDKTIALPEKIYFKYIEDVEKTFIVDYPFLLTTNILKLSDLKVLMSPNEYCELSFDLCREIGMDFDGGLITIFKTEAMNK